MTIDSKAYLESSDAPVALEEALAAFYRLADDGGIAFAQGMDGCHLRAHLMCDELMKRGIRPLKAWAFESETKDPLSARLPDGRQATWWFHVAPVVSTRLPDGRVMPLVMDPGLYDSPVSAEEWGGLLQVRPSRLQIVPYGQAPEGYTGDFCPTSPTTSSSSMHAMMVLSEQMMWDEFGKRKLYPGRFCRDLPGDVPLALSGRKWETGQDLAATTSLKTVPAPDLPGLKR